MGGILDRALLYTRDSARDGYHYARTEILAFDLAGRDLLDEILQHCLGDIEIGDIFSATVTKIMEFGAFVEYLPGKEGLVHISKLDTKRVEKVTDIVNVGDQINVMLVEIDRMGRYNFSRKDALLALENTEEE